MSVFDQWSKYVSEVVARESELVEVLTDHGTMRGNAREALVSGVLQRFLPSSYEVGSGQLIDARGRLSKQVDVIVARRDFPTLRLPDGSAVYLIESVVAAIEVKSQLNPAKLEEALDNCASVGDLSPTLDASRSPRIEELDLKYDSENHSLSGPWPNTERGLLLGRPATYVYAFRGYKESIPDFEKAIARWAKARLAAGKASTLAHIPNCIVAEGCVGIRNSGAQVFGGRLWGMFLGTDDNPLRVFVWDLLRALQVAIPIPVRGDGVVPTVAPYFEQMKEQRYSRGILEIPERRDEPAGS